MRRAGTHAVMRLVGFDAPGAPPVSAADWSGTPLFSALGADSGAPGTSLDRAFAWMSVAIFDDGPAAHRAYADGGDAPPWASGAREHWCGLLEPCSHRGEINWLEPASPGPLFEPTQAQRHEGPLVVVTSVGWVTGPGLDLDRVQGFFVRSLGLRAAMAGVPGLRAVNGFVFGSPLDGSDAITVSFWADAAAMGRFAYRPGRHADEMAHAAAARSYDRSSFTRLRALECRGSWGGGDPLRASH